jgi:predicted RND superfamily exporter protein
MPSAVPGMVVSIWAILGIILVLLWLPISYATPAAGGFTLGAGIAFLIVALSRWVRERWETIQDRPEAESV